MRSQVRREGLDKLTGRERYLDDELIAECLWGMTVRSPVPRGRLKALRFDPGLDWSEFVVVDHRDIPGHNQVRLIELDQPVLASDSVRHVHEPIALIAHASREMCRRAIAGVAVEIDPEVPALDFRKQPDSSAIQHGADNVLSRLSINKGDVETALQSAARVIEGEYETGAQEHVYLENQAMAAWVEGDTVVVRGSMQCPYYVLNALTHALDMDESRVRVIQAPTGGGFGGKEDYPSLIAVHAALLAIKSGRPVRIVYDRDEDMAATTKRHPSLVRHRTGVSEDGRLVAQDIEVVLDAGAYTTLSPVVLSRGIIHAAGPYACDHVRINGRAVLTNSVPYGAFRGFGAPQTLFALERHMDVIAGAIGMSPAEFRRINLIRDGQSTSTGQVIHDGTDRVALLDLALDKSEYDARKVECRSFNAKHPWLRRGVGLASFYHGGGFTGSGEDYLQSVVHVAGLPDGTVEVLSASTEIGQGTETVFSAIAANRLGIDPSQVRIATPDTARVPNSGPTVASRTCMVVGHLIERACDDLKSQLGLNADSTDEGFAESLRRWHQSHPESQLLGKATYEKPPHVNWDEATYRGDAYAVFAWATYVAHVEVDLRTGGCRVLDFHAVQEVGKVVNRTLATGQIQGGVVQGIGWALFERCVWEDGAMRNNQLTNYIIPTTLDVPPIQVAFIENPYDFGGGGSKGLGELPMDGPAPAVVNAISDALEGVVEPAVLACVPMTPERVMECLP